MEVTNVPLGGAYPDQEQSGSSCRKMFGFACYILNGRKKEDWDTASSVSGFIQTEEQIILKNPFNSSESDCI